MALAAEAGTDAVVVLGGAGIARSTDAFARLQTLAALPLLGHVARAAARSGVPLRVLVNDPLAGVAADAALDTAHRRTATLERLARSRIVVPGEGRPALSGLAMTARARPAAALALGSLREEGTLAARGPEQRRWIAQRRHGGGSAGAEHRFWPAAAALVGPELFTAAADLRADPNERTMVMAANRLLWLARRRARRRQRAGPGGRHRAAGPAAGDRGSVRRPTIPALVIAVGVLLLADFLVVNDSLGDLAGVAVDAAIFVAAGAALAGSPRSPCGGRTTCGAAAATRSVRRSSSPAWPRCSSPACDPGAGGASDPAVGWLVAALMLPDRRDALRAAVRDDPVGGASLGRERGPRGDRRSSARRSSCSSCCCRSAAPPATRLAAAAGWALDGADRRRLPGHAHRGGRPGRGLRARARSSASARPMNDSLDALRRGAGAPAARAGARCCCRRPTCCACAGSLDAADGDGRRSSTSCRRTRSCSSASTPTSARTPRSARPSATLLADLLERDARLVFVSLTPEGRALAIAERARLLACRRWRPSAWSTSASSPAPRPRSSASPRDRRKRRRIGAGLPDEPRSRSGWSSAATTSDREAGSSSSSRASPAWSSSRSRRRSCCRSCSRTSRAASSRALLATPRDGAAYRDVGDADRSRRLRGARPRWRCSSGCSLRWPCSASRSCRRLGDALPSISRA